ncbi:polyprenyl synthetase family protein [Hyperthermus butylicus]|uniref:Geranylgeranyl pyrophosphate synthetase n=1 Tax=Hyperthermus butylicus (strain DSM 5456 / JCM 9403 / PLM1-5) TaxID=415426 RepID=A2BK89_HYPBU|nr:polyprenyl synthetase family protein [Hyperthermus butylicus]ABM80400.1 Geranylgeranyl pyrophosphate synthetase [Hyperthermus butylicus DSM 5456]
MTGQLPESVVAYLKRVASLVDGYIYAKVKGEPKEVYDAGLHLIRAGGKRLRPAIVVAIAEALGEPAERALPFAAAVELVHNFTLIHDDIMDRDEFRRGVPTVHKVWGEPLAITAGDLLFAKAFETLTDALDKGIPPDRVARATRVLSRASAVIAEGQAMDLMFEEEDEVSIDEYLIMIYKKTGALFEASAVLGGLVATGDDATLEKLAEFGKNLGIAFQIRDDILGIVGKEEELGKPVYSDIREGKKTLPIIYALRNLEDEDREKLVMVLGNREASREELEQAAKLVVASGAIDYAESKAREYIDRALEALRGAVPENNYRRILEELAKFVATRTW